ADAVGEGCVGRDDDELPGLRVVLDERGYVVVGSVAPGPAGKAHPDAEPAAGVVRPAVEEHRHRLVAGFGERLEPVDEPSLRALAIAPPAVGARAHDVVAVDDPLVHGSHLRGGEPAMWPS